MKMKRNISYICLLLMGIVLSVGCKSKKAVAFSFPDLDGEWEVVEINGYRLDGEKPCPTLVFDMLRRGLSGNAGCNRLMGKIEFREKHENIIRFLQVATTRMACPDMDVEREFLAALERVVRFEPIGETAPVKEIAMFGPSGDKLLVLSQR